MYHRNEPQTVVVAIDGGPSWMPAATAGIFQDLCNQEETRPGESPPKLTMMVTEGRREFFDVIKVQMSEQVTDENPTPYHHGKEIYSAYTRN